MTSLKRRFPAWAVFGDETEVGSEDGRQGCCDQCQRPAQDGPTHSEAKEQRRAYTGMLTFTRPKGPALSLCVQCHKLMTVRGHLPCYAPIAFPAANRVCVARLCGRVGGQHGDFWPGPGVHDDSISSAGLVG